MVFLLVCVCSAAEGYRYLPSRRRPGAPAPGRRRFVLVVLCCCSWRDHRDADSGNKKKFRQTAQKAEKQQTQRRRHRQEAIADKIGPIGGSRTEKGQRGASLAVQLAVVVGHWSFGSLLVVLLFVGLARQPFRRNLSNVGSRYFHFVFEPRIASSFRWIWKEA